MPLVHVVVEKNINNVVEKTHKGVIFLIDIQEYINLTTEIEKNLIDLRESL
jgi:hypothetical protein